MKTQTEASGDLETNQIAQFVLDRIQEDLQCAIFRNDGNVWMVAEVVESVDEIEGWDDTDSTIKKPEIESIRIHFDDWPEEEIVQPNNSSDSQLVDNKEASAEDSVSLPLLLIIGVIAAYILIIVSMKGNEESVFTTEEE